MKVRPSLCVLILLAMIIDAAPAMAQNNQPQAAAPARTIEVSGHGEAHVSPDLAVLNLAIETHAATAEQCASENGALARKVVDAITAKLGGKGKAWTGGYSLIPEYNQARDNQKPSIVGYSAENSITVQTGSLDLIGPIIDTAIAFGANRINSLEFKLRNDTSARGQAITAATKNAQAQAQALAAALGVKLGAVIKATTEQRRPMPVMANFTASARLATPVQPTEVTVPAIVSLTYAIE
ncbi:MAG: SIMPL domain-containing protein [Candidatus Binataceae bacterium]